MNAKHWAWSVGILGIILVISGFLSQTCDYDVNTKKRKASPLVWVSVIIGFLMVIAGFAYLSQNRSTSMKSMGLDSQVPADMSGIQMR